MATKKLVKNKKLKGDDLHRPTKTFYITVKQQEFLDAKRRRQEVFQEAQLLRKLLDLGIKAMEEGIREFTKRTEKPAPRPEPSLPFTPPTVDLSEITKSISTQMEAQVQRIIGTQQIRFDQISKEGRTDSGNQQLLITKLAEQLSDQSRQAEELATQNKTLVNLLVQILGVSNVSSELITSLLSTGKTSNLIEPAQKRGMEETQRMYAQATQKEK